MNQEEPDANQPITSKKFNEMYEEVGYTLYLEWFADILKENEELKQQSIFLCRWEHSEEERYETDFSRYVKAKTEREAIEKLVLNVDESIEVIKIRYQLFRREINQSNITELEKLFNELISLGLMSDDPNKNDCQYDYDDYYQYEEFSKRYHEFVVNNLKSIINLFEYTCYYYESFSIIELNNAFDTIE